VRSPILGKEYRLEVPKYRQLRTVCVSEGVEDTEPGKNPHKVYSSPNKTLFSALKPVEKKREILNLRS